MAGTAPLVKLKSSVFNCQTKPLIKSEHYGFHLWETILNNDLKKNIFLPGCEYRENSKVPLNDLFDKVILLTTNDDIVKTENTLNELIRFV